MPPASANGGDAAARPRRTAGRAPGQRRCGRRRRARPSLGSPGVIQRQGRAPTLRPPTPAPPDGSPSGSGADARFRRPSRAAAVPLQQVLPPTPGRPPSRAPTRQVHRAAREAARARAARYRQRPARPTARGRGSRNELGNRRGRRRRGRERPEHLVKAKAEEKPRRRLERTRAARWRPGERSTKVSLLR